MAESEIIEMLSCRGLLTEESMAAWSDMAKLMAALDAIGRECNALVKIDGGRDDAGVYTVVLSGGRLGDSFFRQDGPALRPLLQEAIEFFLVRTRREEPRGSPERG